MPTIPTRRDANGISARIQPQIILTTPNSVAPKSTKPRKLLVGRMKSLIPVRKSSRRKNPAPRANCTSFGEPRATQNNDYCESCKGLGTFLCCDSCPRSFHLTCLNPPMDQDSIPEDEWHCNSCSPLPLPKGYRRDGLFGNTLEVIHSSNPISFEIPEEIKSCFRGVDTNEYGEFVDTTLLVNPKNKVLSIKSGWTRVLELRDKDVIAICYYCRLSGLRGPIIACDYCSLNWHMDCLTPPLAVPPPPHLKWMCPNHVDHLLPKARFGLLDIDSQQDAHLGLIPSLMNSLPVDEEEIMADFLGRMQKKRKIDRFSQLLQEAEADIFAKLLDPKTLLSNHAALIKAFPSAFPSDPWLYTPRPPDLGAMEVNQTSKRDSIQALLNIFKGHTSRHPPSEQDTFVEMPRTLFHRLNAIGKLMNAVPQEELLDFLVRNPKE